MSRSSLFLGQHWNPSELLIISDLDDTLLTSEHEISPENVAAIQRFIDLGGCFAIASGRSVPPVKRLNIPTNVPSILYNGSVVYDLNQDEVLWKLSLNDSAARGLLEDIHQHFPDAGVEVITLQGTYVVYPNQETSFHIELEHISPLAQGCSISSIQEDWQKIMIDWAPEQLAQVKEYLDHRHTEGTLPFHYGYSYPILIELTHPDANKGTALLQLSKLTNVAIDHIIAVGDNMNDAELLETAGISITPSNGQSILKERADYISVDHNQHVMVDLLQQIERSMEGS